MAYPEKIRGISATGLPCDLPNSKFQGRPVDLQSDPVGDLPAGPLLEDLVSRSTTFNR